MSGQGEILLTARRRANVRVPCGDLESLEPADERVPTAAAVPAAVAAYGVHEQTWGLYLVWFIITALIVWVILYLLRPAFLSSRNPDGSYTGIPDTGKTLGAAVVIALIVVLIVWLVRRA